MAANPTRRLFLAGLLAAAAAAGCRNGGNFSLLGYTTEPPFDPNIRSVYVPTFKLMPVVTTPLRNLDVEMTDAVVKELTARKSPIKVVSDPARADTELIGTIVNVQKVVLSRTPQALPLETELYVHVEVVWRDLRTGEILSNPRMARRSNPDPGRSTRTCTRPPRRRRTRRRSTPRCRCGWSPPAASSPRTASRCPPGRTPPSSGPPGTSST